MKNILNNISNKGMSLVKQILIILFYFFIILFLQNLMLDKLLGNDLLIKSVCNILINTVIMTIFILIFRKEIIPDYYDFKKNAKVYIKKYFIFWIIGLATMIISNAIIGYFYGLPSNEEANRELLSNMPIYSIITMIIMAPITEELLTRVCLKTAFKNSYIYALLSGLIFGSLHLLTADSNILFIIPYGALGVSLSLIYHKSNNIWTNIFFHSLHNTIAILLVFLGSI